MNVNTTELYSWKWLTWYILCSAYFPMIFKDIYWVSDFWMPIILQWLTQVSPGLGELYRSMRGEGVMLLDWGMHLHRGKGCFGPKLRWTSGAMEKDHICLSGIPSLSGIPISAWLRLSTRGPALPCPQSPCLQGHLNQFSPLTGLLSAPFQNPALPFLLGLRF